MNTRAFNAALLPGLVLAAAASTSLAGFYGDPPDQFHPWAIHDDNRPQPPRVEPGTYSTQESPGKPPSDAVVLFDGTEASLANWLSDKEPAEPTKWIVKDGTFQCVPGAGYVRTKAEWGDCQLHVEWSAPAKVEGSSQGRGNSGIFPMGQVEVQVLDNFNNPTYADGFAGSVYGINPPFANALHGPGEWQVYDIVFRRPIFKDGKMVTDGHLTVFVNGVLTQDATPLEGGGGHRARSKDHPFPEKGPLKLQDHGNPVRYRNIWYRPLPPRSADGGTDGKLTPEAATAKRASIAAGIRTAAASKTGNAKLLGLLESLCYETQPEAVAEAGKLTADYAASLEGASADVLESKKGEIQQLRGALDYLNRFKIIPAPPALATIQKVIKERGWDDKK
ncbi:MAG: hypothetical protein JWM59_3967 [Verrucomicrobiales bacterium]|nr:hypothetical protein [Verrucomicrobiales bacterium]